MSNFYILSIKEITQETYNSVSITFDIPLSLKANFYFIPGQYITIQKELNGEQLRRDYSICSSIKSNELKIGIKAVKNGIFSQYATSKLKVGDELEVSSPQGRFNLPIDKNNNKNYLAFTAGSGITPVLSMINSVLEEEPKSKFVLVYGNKTKDDVMFKAEINDLAKQYENKFFVHYIFSQSPHIDHLFGRIDASIVNRMINNIYNGVKFDNYFLCGPELMINAVKTTLISAAIIEDKIHFELFAVSTTNESVESNNLEGHSEVTVILDDDEETFSMSKKSTILDVALSKGLDAPYSCQGGICSSCLAQVTEGKAIMDSNTILSDEEVEEGMILTCQAHPITDKITIDYDAV